MNCNELFWNTEKGNLGDSTGVKVNQSRKGAEIGKKDFPSSAKWDAPPRKVSTVNLNKIEVILRKYGEPQSTSELPGREPVSVNVLQS